MRLPRTALLFLLSLTAFVSTFLPPNLPALLATPQVVPQTSNEQKLDKNPATTPAVSGSFIDYLPEEAQLKGHEGSVNSASFSPDGKLIVTAGTDGTARVWDTSGKQIVELRGHWASVRSASFSPDGKRIATASFDGTARVWDLSGKQLVELAGHQGNVYSASFSPDGGRIVTAGADKSARVWDASGKLLVEIKGHSGSVYSASFSPDGLRIVTASADKTARVWDLSGKPLAELTGHTDTVWSASFSPNGKRIVTASDDKTARLWNLSDEELTVLEGHQDSVYSASFSPDGQQIVTASMDSITLVWDSSGKLRGKLKGHKGSINSVNFSGDGRKIVTASVDGSVRVWDTSRTLFTKLQGHLDWVNGASFSPDGKRIVTASSDKTVRVWDLSGKQIVELVGHQDKVKSASFSPDGKLIVTASADKTARIWKSSGKQLVELKGGWSWVLGANFSPDGKLIVTASAGYTAQVWDTSGRLKAELKGHKLGVNSASFSPDGKHIVTASSDKTARVWDTSGKLLAELKGHQGWVSSASFSPDGKLIITASNDKTARVWDTFGKLRLELKGHQSGLDSASFSPDGKRIVTTSQFDGTVRIWDTSGTQLAELDTRDSSITGASFSPDGKQILILEEDNLWVWYLPDELPAQISLPEALLNVDLATIQNPETEIKSERGFNSASFSPDGKWILTASSDSIARIWDTSGKLVTEIKRHQIDGYNGSFRASFSSDGQQIVTVSESQPIGVLDTSGKLLTEIKNQNGFPSLSPDGKVIVTTSIDSTRVWNTTGKLLMEVGSAYRANFSSDGQLIVLFFTYDRTARVLDISGKLLAELKGYPDYFRSASFSPDGKLIIMVSDTSVWLWDTSGQRVSNLINLPYSVRSASFTPDGKRIVTTSPNAVRLWDTSGKLIAELTSHQNRFFDTITSLSPDGKLIFVASENGIARIWDTSGNLVTEIKGHRGRIGNASFSADGKLLVTAGVDGTARMWNLSGKQLAIMSLTAPPSSPKTEADRLRDLEFYAPNCAQAFEPWQKALKIYQDLTDYENESLMWEKLGNASYCLSDYTNAINSYSQALDIANKHVDSIRQSSILSKLGNLYNSLANYEKAIEYYNQALEIIRIDWKLKADVFRGRGNAYNSLGKSDKAIPDYLRALNIDESQRNRSGIARNKVSLARIYQSLGDYNKALQYYKEAEEFNPIEALAGLGTTYLVLGDTAKAIDLHQQSLEKARQQEDKEGEANALNNLAYALRQAGKLVEAEQYLREAIEIWENLRTKLDDANKVSIFEKQARTYRLLQEILIAQNKPNEALEIAERGRARAFVELLNSRISPNQKEQPITPPNIELLKQIAKDQKANLVQYSIITDTFKVQGKEQTKESELYIWVIKPTGEITFRRSDLKPLWQKENLTLTQFVTLSREAIGVSRGGMYDVKVVAQSQPDQTQRLQQLHNLLIKPIADVLPTDENDRVIFIPHQELFLVPFGALQDESGKYLIEKHTILTAPSIQVLQLTHQQRQRGATRGNDALVVGNPTMPKIALTIGELPKQLPPLQGAETEAKAIASLLNTQALTGSSATKAAILPKLPSARIIHLATHGILDNIQGLKSAIALAPTNTDNGLLTAEEILQLKLNASLVVLSACNTGSGRITGDGVIGLSRSLFLAGTPSVIVSLWAVPDALTQELMTEFYRQFKLTGDKAQSLRQAMLKMKEKYPDAPRKWAAFTLIGEAE
jgi:WD40 repeat protein/CHAT domain-containing protein